MNTKPNTDTARQAAEAWSAEAAAEDSQFVLSPVAAHRINLGPPWEITSGTGGTTRHARKFGWLRPLGVPERLWLICDHIPSAAEVHLNGSPLSSLAAAAPLAIDITPLVQTRNEVVFALPSDAPLGDVCLEVRPA